MKKFYSLLIALLALVGVAQAQTITFDATTDIFGTDKTKTGAMEISKDGVSIAITGGTLANGTEYRIYKNQTLTVSCESTIAEIVFTCTAENQKKYGPGCFDAQEGYSYDSNVGTWTGSATSTSFKAGADQVRATKIEVTLKNEDPNYVATPKITPATGTYYSAQTVTINCATDGATIYYTTDGDVPTTESTVYTEPFTVEVTTNIKAYAVKGENSSAVIEELITIEEAETKTIAEILSSGPADGVQTSATVVAVSSIGVLLQDATDYIFKYTGSEPGVAVGDVVTVIGDTKEYGGRLQFTENGTMEKTGAVVVEYPRAVVLDGAAFDALVSNIQIQYVELAATVASVGNYYNLTISGATNTGSVIAASDLLKELKVNDEVKITGFFVYVTGTTKKYGYIIATKIELPQVDYTEYNTLAAVKAAAPAEEASATYAQLNVDNLLVSYVNGQSVYLFDGADGMLVYGDNSGIKAGDKISGSIQGKLYQRYGNTQLASPLYSITVNSSNNEIPVAEVEADGLVANVKAYENVLVLVKGLVPNATTWDDKRTIAMEYSDDDDKVTTIVVRDNWKQAEDITLSTEDAYKVTGFVSIYVRSTEAGEEVNDVQLFIRSSDDIDGVKIEPNPYQFVGNGSLETPYIAEDVQHIDATSTKEPAEEDKWVKAYIVGYINGSTLNESTAMFSADAPEGVDKNGNPYTVAPSNILLADAAETRDVKAVIPVALPTGYARTNLNLADNKDMLGKQVWLKGDIYKYMGVSGLKNVKVYSLDGTNIEDAINDITADASITSKNIYTLAGQRVQNLVKGLYIVNGQKVVVK